MSQGTQCTEQQQQQQQQQQYTHRQSYFRFGQSLSVNYWHISQILTLRSMSIELLKSNSAVPESGTLERFQLIGNTKLSSHYTKGTRLRINVHNSLLLIAGKIFDHVLPAPIQPLQNLWQCPRKSDSTACRSSWHHLHFNVSCPSVVIWLLGRRQKPSSLADRPS